MKKAERSSALGVPVEAPCKIPLGISDFKKLRRGGYLFVDKSKFIIELLQLGSEVSLITRPRRFGKTLNLSMLYYFFGVDKAKRHKKLFAGLEVSRDARAMAEMGKYPVVMLSLKSVKATTMKGQLEALEVLMSDLYDEHEYLYDKLSDSNKHIFDQTRRRKLNRAGLESSLQRLIRFVERHHQAKVVVLMDEYDCPLIQAFYFGFEDSFKLFFRAFMGNSLKDNRAVRLAVVTGIVQIAGSGLFSDFNNATVFHVLDESYATDFGFDQGDIDTLLAHFGRYPALNQTAMSYWYNGYLFGQRGHEIYNPWSVLHFIQYKRPDDYWLNSSDNKLLERALYRNSDETKSKLLVLIGKGEIRVQLPKSLRFNALGVGDEAALWILLLSTGYLKARTGVYRGGGTIDAWLSIPNEEVRLIYHKVFYAWVATKTRDTAYSPDSLIGQLQRGEIKAFCKNLKGFFLASVSSHDVRVDNVETFYHGFVLALLGLMHETHMGHLRSNLESGLGRFDISFEPHDKAQYPGIIFELKRLGRTIAANKTASDLKHLLKISAKAGLEQIKDKLYNTDLIYRGVRKMAYISLAFSGKHMQFKCEGPLHVAAVTLSASLSGVPPTKQARRNYQHKQVVSRVTP